LPGTVLLGRARWYVELPQGWLPLHVAGAAVEQRWAWWGWLLAPRPAVSSEGLESWFAGPDTPALPNEGEPRLVCWQGAEAPVRVWHVPQQAWLLVCSLVFLGVGLGLSFLPLPRTAFWCSVALLGAFVALVSVWWPGTLPLLLYGCEPAALVLLLV